MSSGKVKISMNKAKKAIGLVHAQEKVEAAKFCVIENITIGLPTNPGFRLTKSAFKFNKHIPAGFKENLKFPLYMKSFNDFPSLKKHLKTTQLHPVLIKADNVFFNTKSSVNQFDNDPKVIFSKLNRSLSMLPFLRLVKTHHPALAEQNAAEAAAKAAAEESIAPASA